jgi:UDP-GlcNAc:undecaprenyl-phosphate GlcNAc-1-phosphate transferase
MLSDVYINVLLASLTAFIFVNFVIPSIIKIAEIKHLYDAPDDRKSHQTAIPNLGGVAIFGGFLISYCLFGHLTAAKELQYILAALCLVFMLGTKDDIVELDHKKKFIGQILAAIIITYFGDIRLTSLYGVFGITLLPYWVSLVFSVVTIVFIINAFNLIDGINWLASGVSVIISITFGFWFFFHGFHEYAILSASIAGAVIGFMRFNYTPAKIFMGDSGSLSVGLIAAVLAIVFIEKSSKVAFSSVNDPFYVIAAPSFAISVLIIPIFDTLRVFALRIIKGRSPFVADRNHIHHKLIDLGLTHIQSSLILMSVNISFIILAYYLQFIRNVFLILLLFVLAFVFTSVLFSFKSLKKPALMKASQENKVVNLTTGNVKMEKVSPS